MRRPNRPYVFDTFDTLIIDSTIAEACREGREA